MERAQKVEFLEKLTDRFGRAPIAVLTDYRGINVAKISELRRRVREADGEYMVTKNTLARLAVKDTSAAGLAEMLKGPTGIAFGFSDPVALAKAVTGFAKEHETFVVKGAVLEGEVLPGERVAQIAAMLGRDELRAQLLALLMTPAAQLVRVLAAPSRAMVQVLDARRRQQEGA
jgi:large subunit ribosomal protein L10